MTRSTPRPTRVAFVALVLATVCSHTTDATIDAPLDSLTRDVAPGTFFWVGDHRLHLNCIGRGSPTVIFDSGLGGSSLDWVRVQPQVATFTRACSYDRAGYGWSDSGPLPRDSESISQELEALLGNASVSAPYLLVGHSFGGFNVRLFTHHNPRQVAGLILVDPSHEDQFRRFDAAGVGSTAPRTGTFFVRGGYQVPDDMPSELLPLARSLAVTHRSMSAFYSELRHLRSSAEQLRKHAAMPDVPVIVISHKISDRLTSGIRAKRERIWMAMQADLVRRAVDGQHVIATTNRHHVHLSQPQLVIDTIKYLVDRNNERSSGVPSAAD